MVDLVLCTGLLVILVIVLLFGRGKISDLMGDVAKGIKSFKEGLADINEDPAKPKPGRGPAKVPRSRAGRDG